MRTPIHVIGGLLLCITLSSSLVACSSFSPDERPLPDSTLVDVLMEFHLAQVRTHHFGDTTFVALRDSILSHYDIPEAQLEEALRYYSRHPSAYASLHDAVRDSLEAHRQRLLRD